MHNGIFLRYAKRLPHMGIITFCGKLTSPEVRKQLPEWWSIDEAANALSSIDAKTLYYKGDRLKGNVEHHANDFNPRRFLQKCNVQMTLRKIAYFEERNEIEGLEPFYIIFRKGKGPYVRYCFLRRADSITEKEKETREHFISRSRLAGYVAL